MNFTERIYHDFFTYFYYFIKTLVHDMPLQTRAVTSKNLHFPSVIRKSENASEKSHVSNIYLFGIKRVILKVI